MSTRAESVPDTPRTAPDPGRHPAPREHPVPQPGTIGVLSSITASTTIVDVAQGIYRGLHVLPPAGARGGIALSPVATASPAARVTADALRGRRCTG